jgi:hypothetical protein
MGHYFRGHYLPYVHVMGYVGRAGIGISRLIIGNMRCLLDEYRLVRGTIIIRSMSISVQVSWHFRIDCHVHVDSNVKSHMILLHSLYWDFKYVGK